MAIVGCSAESNEQDDDGGSGGASTSTTVSAATGTGGSKATYIGFEDAAVECEECLPGTLTENGPCAGDYATCLENEGCAAVMECVTACQGSPDCIFLCNQQHPAFEERLVPYLTCVCCVSACKLPCEYSCMWWSGIAGPAYCGE